jgi:hypothetical protein
MQTNSSPNKHARFLSSKGDEGRIPTGFRHRAQARLSSGGFAKEDKATLGNPHHDATTPTGLRLLFVSASSRRRLQVLCCLLISAASHLYAGEGVGAPLFPGSQIKTAQVIAVHDPNATDAFRARPDTIRAMVNCGITNLIGTNSLRDAWRSIVSGQETIGIKVFSTPGPNSGTRSSVVAAVIEGLIAGGIAPKRIVIWDRQLGDLKLAGYADLSKRYGVRLAGSAQAGYDEHIHYDYAFLGTPVWGDLEFGKQGEGVGRKSYLSKLVTREFTKIINITPLLNHNAASVSGNLYGLAMGSVDNVGRFESDADRLATAVPEIYAMTNLSDHVVLNITDALICQYEGGERGLLHYSATLNELRFSRDPVALDVLSVEELERQRKKADAPTVKPNVDLYRNAGLLELGVDDLKRIQVKRIEMSQ